MSISEEESRWYIVGMRIMYLNPNEGYFFDDVKIIAGKYLAMRHFNECQQKLFGPQGQWENGIDISHASVFMTPVIL